MKARALSLGAACALPWLAFGYVSPAAQATGPVAQARRQLTLESCHVPDLAREVRCGIFSVPEDRTKPAGKMLPLRVVVVPARSAEKAREPVFYFEGGPGESATESAAYVADLWINEHRDVVLVDQRGAGEGHALDCELPGSDSDVQGYLEKPYAAYARCATELAEHADLTQYVTPIAMADVDELRQTLGYEMVNLYGASYGSRAAMIYSKLYGEHVRTVYLSGVAPLELRIPLYFAKSVQRAFEMAVAECTRDTQCNQTYSDPKGDFELVREQLSQAPAKVRIKHPATGQPVDVTLTEWGFVTAMMTKLYSAEDPTSIPSILRRARAADFSELVESWIKSIRTGREKMRRGMHLAIICNEDVPQIQPQDVEKETAGTFLGSTAVLATIELCKSWPKAKLPADFFAPFTSNVPTLITSGAFDPVTPSRWGEVARKYFPNSLHLVTAKGHHFDERGCLGAIASAFLSKATVKRLDLSCARDPQERLTVMQ